MILLLLLSTLIHLSHAANRTTSTTSTTTTTTTTATTASTDVTQPNDRQSVTPTTRSGFASSPRGTSLTVRVASKDRFCFYEDFPRDTQLRFEYQVVAGGKRDVDVDVHSPNRKLVFSRKRRKKEEGTFDVSPGTWEFCLSNAFSHISDKTVWFWYGPAEAGSQAEAVGDERPTVLSPLLAAMEAMFRSLVHVTRYQQEYRLKEAVSRYNAEKLNDRVSVWSLVQTAAILVCGLGQVFILKMFFTEKRNSKPPQPAMNTLNEFHYGTPTLSA